jgi:mono/diheme cytochrome c family protein
MEEYPVKVLLAFGETFKGNAELHRWLMENGYPEFAALDSAIDNKVGAYLWLRNNDFEILAAFADACNRKTEAAAWLKERGLEVFLYLADCINHFRDNQYFDHHKKRF